MEELHRLRYVTRWYPHLQGLRLLPLSVPFLLSAAWREGYLRWVPGTSGVGAQRWFGALFLVALAIAAALGPYYTRRFGSVQAARRLRDPVSFIAFVLGLAFAMWLQDRLHATMSVPLVVIGIAIGYVGVLDRLARAHYLTLSALCLIAAMLGTFGVPAHQMDVVLDTLTGLGLIVVGIGDHLLIRHTLHPVSNVQAV